LLAFFALKPPVLWGYAGLLILHVVVTAVPLAVRPFRPGADFRDYNRRALGWWITTFTQALFLALGPQAFAALYAWVSLQALKELIGLSAGPLPKGLRLSAALVTLLPYVMIILGGWSPTVALASALGLLLPLAVSVVAGHPGGFMQRTGLTVISVLIAGTCLSHTAALVSLPDRVNPVAGGPGLFLFAIFLAQFNDLAQYGWGKALGRRRIVPELSPSKTWAGFVGGMLTTAGVAWLLAPWLTPISPAWAPLVGLVIAVAGFWGDITVSALKRDAGVKDTGTILPGFGGVMDRLDSLIYVIPAFFYCVLALS
jgi:phosphatidate cytidylyltransferase